MNIGYDKCPILETCWLKIQNGHVSGKVVPHSGGSCPGPIGLKSKTALITKRWRKKGPQLLPEERIINDARRWAGRLGVHSKHQLHLRRVHQAFVWGYFHVFSKWLYTSFVTVSFSSTWTCRSSAFQTHLSIGQTARPVFHQLHSHFSWLHYSCNRKNCWSWLNEHNNWTEQLFWDESHFLYYILLFILLLILPPI